MLTKEIISKLDSNNVSKDLDHTKAVVTRLWNGASNQLKQQAVNLGSYKNTKSFAPVKDIGKISVRMAVVLAQVFQVNPFHIIDPQYEDTGCSEEILSKFLQAQGFGNYASVDPEDITFLKKYINNLLDSIHLTPEIANLSVEQIVSLIEALNTQTKLNNKTARSKLALIKLILAH